MLWRLDWLNVPENVNWFIAKIQSYFFSKATGWISFKKVSSECFVPANTIDFYWNLKLLCSKTTDWTSSIDISTGRLIYFSSISYFPSQFFMKGKSLMKESFVTAILWDLTEYLYLDTLHNTKVHCYHGQVADRSGFEYRSAFSAIFGFVEAPQKFLQLIGSNNRILKRRVRVQILLLTYFLIFHCVSEIHFLLQIFFCQGSLWKKIQEKFILCWILFVPKLFFRHPLGFSDKLVCFTTDPRFLCKWNPSMPSKCLKKFETFFSFLRYFSSFQKLSSIFKTASFFKVLNGFPWKTLSSFCMLFFTGSRRLFAAKRSNPEKFCREQDVS